MLIYHFTDEQTETQRLKGITQGPPNMDMNPEMSGCKFPMFNLFLCAHLSLSPHPGPLASSFHICSAETHIVLPLCCMGHQDTGNYACPRDTVLPPYALVGPGEPFKLPG